MADRIFTFWNGKLTWLEQLCLNSQLAQGHTIVLFTYAPAQLQLAVASVQVIDAREILPKTAEVERILKVAPQIVADWFRYRGIAAGAGTWVDTDMLLLKPIPQLDRLYGFEHPSHKKINNAVLRLNPDDAILSNLISLSDTRPVMAPWWRGKRAIRHSMRKAIGMPIAPEHCQWGVFGPKALTYFVEKNGGWADAKHHSWFYPVPFDLTINLLTPGEDILEHLRPETIGIHLWGSRVRKLLNGRMPPKRSVLDRALRYGLG